MRRAIVPSLLLALAVPAAAQDPKAATRAQLQANTQQDHRLMMQALGISSLRPGANPVFRLLGKKDLGTSEFPEVETPVVDGELAFRQHRWGHTTGPNWPTFLAFADRYIKLQDAPAIRATSGQ